MGGAFAIAVAAGCASSPGGGPFVATGPLSTATATAAIPSLEAAGPYQAFSGEPLAKGCGVRELSLPPLCSGLQRCPVVRNRLATCEGGASEPSVAGSTVVFGVQNGPATGFAIWPAGGPLQAYGNAGSAPQPARSRDGALTIVRVEGQRLVDYRQDGQGPLERRVWTSTVEQSDHLLNATWIGPRLVAWLSKDYRGASVEVTASESGAPQRRDIPSPPSPWSNSVVAAHFSDARPYALLYGSSGVGILAGDRVWQVPMTVSRTAAEHDVLVPESGVPTFAFKSFDFNDSSGAHVLFPKGTLTGFGPESATDLHLLFGRFARENDCLEVPLDKPRACKRVEKDSQGAALARTSDGRAWLAEVVTTREHRASSRRVCPPPPNCSGGRPCREEPCRITERDVHDSVRHELVVVRLSSDGTGAELGIRYELADLAGVDIVRAVEMDAEGSRLHVAALTGDSKVLWLELDTKAMTLAPLGAADVTVTPVELSVRE